VRLNVKIIQKIASLSSFYKKRVFDTAPAFLEERDLKKIKDEWWLSLIYFFDRVFYQGRNDTVSGQFEKATINALKLYFNNPESENLEKLKQKDLLEWVNYGFQKGKSPVEGLYSKPLHECLTKTYDFSHEGKDVTSSTGKQRDRAMVIDTLKFISELPDYNILSYSIKEIKKGKLMELDSDLRNIRQVGLKTCSLYLRDTVSFYSLEKYLSRPDYDVLQPIDTWVHQMAIKLDIIKPKMKLEELASKRCIITNAACNAGVSPIDFNQGLWYLPTHAVDLLLKEYNKK